jgi:hypothetical protein
VIESNTTYHALACATTNKTSKHADFNKIYIYFSSTARAIAGPPHEKGLKNKKIKKNSNMSSE